MIRGMSLSRRPRFRARSSPGLSTTVATTLANEPGVSVRFNCPAAAPVIRGLSGERVLVLQDLSYGHFSRNLSLVYRTMF